MEVSHRRDAVQRGEEEPLAEPVGELDDVGWLETAAVNENRGRPFKARSRRSSDESRQAAKFATLAGIC